MLKRKTSTEKTIAYLSLSLTILILLSIVFNILYYQKYNIEITNYIDISESLALFLPYFESILLDALPKVIGLYIGLFVLPKYIKRFCSRKKQREKVTVSEANESWSSIIAGTFGAYFGSELVNYLITGSFWTFESALLTTAVFSISVYHKIKLPFRLYFPEITIVFIVYLTYFFFQSLYGQPTIEKSKNYRQLIILKESNKLIQSDSITSIIGKTKDFVFIYNSKENSTTVIPKDEIKQIEIKIIPKQ